MMICANNQLVDKRASVLEEMKIWQSTTNRAGSQFFFARTNLKENKSPKCESALYFRIWRFGSPFPRKVALSRQPAV
jgi:hypothetical protein